MDVDINTDTMRARRSKTTPVSERKLINRATTKTTSVKKIFASLSEQLNENNSVLVGADDSHLSIREADMEFSSPRGRAGSFNDSDSPWQNGQFKSPKEIVRYYREQFGDWWNVLPKTDFTYDESSKWYRKEIAPGIPVIPNLARPPLHPVEQISRFNLFSRSSGSSHETSSSNGKSQFSRFPILERDNRSFLSKVSDFIIDCLLGLLCLPYDLLFGNYWNSKSSSVTGRNSTSNKSVWWTAPFRWTYQLMMLLFSWEIMILVTVRGFFKNLGLRTAFKLFLFLSIVGSIVWAYGHFGVELSTIQIPSINISDFQNFTEWDYSGAIEMLKPLNMSWAYDQYENLVNIKWIYE